MAFHEVCSLLVATKVKEIASKQADEHIYQDVSFLLIYIILSLPIFNGLDLFELFLGNCILGNCSTVVT